MRLMHYIIYFFRTKLRMFINSHTTSVVRCADMKKKIFLSYSSLRSSDAAVVETYFDKNGAEVIKDTKEKDSFWRFMDKIAECDCVVMLLNNSYFESPLCTYELVKSYICNKKIYPIWFGDFELTSEEDRKELYDNLIKRDINIAPKQKEEFLDKIETFDKYNEILLKLIHEVKYPQNGDFLMDACNEIYIAIYNEPAKISCLEDEMNIRSRYMHDLDYVDDESLRGEFIWLIGDLMRCSSIRTSLFAEDPSGENEWQFKRYSIKKGSIGYSFFLYVSSLEGKNQIIDIHDICGIHCNRDNYGDTFLKYYVEVIDRELFKKYLYQMSLPQNIRNKETLAKYEQYGKACHRITLIFKDCNALDNISSIVR